MDALTKERRLAINGLISHWMSEQDPEGRVLDTLDYFDVDKIDELIDEAIAPAIADAVAVALAALPSDAAQAPLPAIQGYDLTTSAGGCGYLVEYFATRLRTHTYQRYIEERLAKDFACALSKHLSERDAAPVAPAAAAPIDWRELLAAVLRESRYGGGYSEAWSGPENAPGHAHDVAGIWDSDNHASIAGKPCSWCIAWNAARAALATTQGAAQ